MGALADVFPQVTKWPALTIGSDQLTTLWGDQGSPGTSKIRAAAWCPREKPVLGGRRLPSIHSYHHPFNCQTKWSYQLILVGWKLKPFSLPWSSQPRSFKALKGGNEINSFCKFSHKMPLLLYSVDFSGIYESPWGRNLKGVTDLKTLDELQQNLSIFIRTEICLRTGGASQRHLFFSAPSPLYQLDRQRCKSASENIENTCC